MAKKQRVIIVLIIALVIITGVFTYVKIKDNSYIDTIDSTITSYKSRNEKLIRDLDAIRVEAETYVDSIRELEQKNRELGSKLEAIKKRSMQLESLISGSISITRDISSDNQNLENSIRESLEIVEKLKVYYSEQQREVSK